MSKKLVAYFSASGVTEKRAKLLAELLKCDIFEIKPKEKYEKKDLNWLNPLSRSSVEMKKRIKPELAAEKTDISQYDTIFVGFPIWWYIAPTIINAFLEEYDFSGKKIVLFATSGGSGFGKTVDELRGSVSDTAEIIEGGVFNGKDADEKLKGFAAKY